MARPFAVIGFTLCLSLITSSFLGLLPSLIVGSVLLICLFLAFFIHKKEVKQYFLLVLSVFLIGLSLFSYHQVTQVLPAKSLIGTTATVTGKLLQLPTYNGASYSYQLKTTSVSLTDAPQSIKLLVSSKDKLPMSISDTVKLIVQFSDNANSSTYGDGYYLRARSLGMGTVTSAKTTTIYAKIMKGREYSKKELMKLLPGEEGTILTAMVLGDRSTLQDDIRTAFSETGVYHLFSVSGLHVSLWAMLVFSIFKRIGLNRKASALLSIVVTVFYMALTGFSMSVLRAGIMSILLLMGRSFLKSTDALNSLGLAVGVLCLFNPMAIFSISFLLTVASSLGIVTMAQWWNQKFAHVFEQYKGKKIYHFILESLLISVAITLTTFPIFLFFFQKVTVISILTNLIFIPLGTVAIVLGGLVALFIWLPMIATPLALLAGLSAKLMIWLAKAFSELSITTIGVNQSYLMLWMACTFLLLGTALLIRRNTSCIKMCSVLSAIMLVVCMGSSFALNRDLLHVRVLDVGNGTAVLVNYQGKIMLIGCGGNYRTRQAIITAVRLQNEKEIDLLLMPTFEKKDSSELLTVTNALAVRTVVFPYENKGLKPKCEEVVASSNLSIAFCPSIRVNYRYEEAAFYVLLTYNESTVLITNTSLSKNLIDEASLSAPTLLICARKLPATLKGQMNVVSGDANAVSLLPAKSAKDGSTAITGDAGMIYIKMNQNGSYQLRREV